MSWFKRLFVNEEEAVEATVSRTITQQSVMCRAGGAVGGVLVAQSQGWGTTATVACAVGGYALGSVGDAYLNGRKQAMSDAEFIAWQKGKK